MAGRPTSNVALGVTSSDRLKWTFAPAGVPDGIRWKFGLPALRPSSALPRRLPFCALSSSSVFNYQIP